MKHLVFIRFVLGVFLSVAGLSFSRLSAQVITTVGDRVGIGTSTPGAALDVIRPGNPNVYENGVRANRPDSQGQYAFMGYGQSSSDAYFGSVYTGSAGSYGRIFLRQYTQGMTARDALVIDSNGNVGIGTNGPGGSLDIQKASSTGLSVVRVFANASGQGDNMTHFGYNTGSGAYNNYLRGATTYVDSALNANNGLLVTSGNVGIGTNPIRTLHVNGELSVTRSDKIAFINVSDPSGNGGGTIWLRGLTSNGSAGADATILLQGNVGIGTTAPLSKLHVQGVGRFGLNDAGLNNIGGILVASGTGVGGARQYWIGASDPTSHNNNMFQISDYNGSTNVPLLTIYGAHAGSAGGNVGIGTTSPTHKLTVNGQVKAKGFLADTSNWADFVFEPDYPLVPLPEVEAHIREKGHLPGVPSAAEVREQGVDLMTMQVKLLQKVEELTLHLIAQEKRLSQLEDENRTLRVKLNQP